MLKHNFLVFLLLFITLVSNTTIALAGETMLAVHSNEIIPPANITTVYLKGRGFEPLENNLTPGLYTSSSELNSVLDHFVNRFDTEAVLEPYPPLSAVRTRYDESFFQNHVLLLVFQEAWHSVETAKPASPVQWGNMYVQNNSIYIEYTREAYAETPDFEAPFEYYHFIEIRKENLANYDYEAWGSQNPRIELICISAPQTSDPTTALTITAASALIALCLVPVASGKRRRG